MILILCCLLHSSDTDSESENETVSLRKNPVTPLTPRTNEVVNSYRNKATACWTILEYPIKVTSTLVQGAATTCAGLSTTKGIDSNTQLQLKIAATVLSGVGTFGSFLSVVAHKRSVFQEDDEESASRDIHNDDETSCNQFFNSYLECTANVYQCIEAPFKMLSVLTGMGGTIVGAVATDNNTMLIATGLNAASTALNGLAAVAHKTHKERKKAAKYNQSK